jgi:uncharacterized protein
MTAEQNAAIVRGYMEAFLGGDFDAAQRFLADDVALHVPGRNPLSGAYRGRDEVVHFLRQMGQLTGGTLEFEIRDVLANEHHVVVLFNPSGNRPGKVWGSRAVSVYRLANSAIEEITVYQHDLYAFDAFMS